MVPSHQIQSLVWSLRKGYWTFVPVCYCEYVSAWGAACGGRKDDEDAWSAWVGGSSGADARLVGRMGGVRGVGRMLSCRLFWPFGGWVRVRLFSSALALAGLEVEGLGGTWGCKKGCVACWPGSRSRGSADVCMVASRGCA